MNEADPSPINLDELRMLPDWLRENAPPPSQQYAQHDYPAGDDRGERRGGRPGGFGGNRGDRRDAPRGGGNGSPDRRREGGRSGPPSRGGMDRDRGPRPDRPQAAGAPPAPALPAPVMVEFLPDDRCLASINKQIRATHLAYPLFGLARMFLQEPERHYVQFSVAREAPAGTLLHQLGEDGPVTLDRAILEKTAFDTSKDQYYVEESVQKEPLKGNFTNVARERLSGTLLGPTNYHAYQPALRSLYESRYSRRMSFEDFRRNIEVSTDPALVERWKEEARTTTTISTRVGEGETPVVLNTLADARAHFRQHHLENLLKSGTTLRVHGSVARSLPEPALMNAIRGSHDREMRYPAQFVQLLRQGLQNCGLHIFKHRKRVVYVSLARPTPFVARGAVSPSVTAILGTIAGFPLCTRKVLADRFLAQSGAVPADAAPVAEPASAAPPTPQVSAEPPSVSDDETMPEQPVADEAAADVVTEPKPTTPTSAAAPEDPAAKARAALAADLRFLVQSGHIIEFHNGTFDLPLPPRPKEPIPVPGKKPGGSQPSKQAATGAGAPLPVPSGEMVAAEASTTPFTATGTDADDSFSDSDPLDEVPSMLAVKEPAPSAVTVADPAEDPDRSHLTADEVVILPGASGVGDQSGEIRDKTDDDGRISGADAAPLDPPIPGDLDGPPIAQP